MDTHYCLCNTEPKHTEQRECIEEIDRYAAKYAGDVFSINFDIKNAIYRFILVDTEHAAIKQWALTVARSLKLSEPHITQVDYIQSDQRAQMATLGFL
jgi:hypothetical protein